MVKLRAEKVVFIVAMLVCLSAGGCGFVSVFSTPGRAEIKIPPEYDLTEQLDKKVVVVVEQPAWLGGVGNLRYYLTRGVNAELKDKLGYSEEQLVSYDEVQEFRYGEDGHGLKPEDIAVEAGADFAIVIEITGATLDRLGQADYYRGSLECEAMLFDVAEGCKVWPDQERSKAIRIGFEIETGGQEAALKRLGSSTAYCVVRYLYYCHKDIFKIADERGQFGWEE